MGGPAAWLQRTHGCEVVGVDLMEQNVRAARGLFDQVLTAVGSTYAIPFASRCFRGIWAVGVLELVEDKAAALREMARVLEPGGRAALYSFTTVAPELEDPPASDYFVPPEGVVSSAGEAGLEVRRAAPAAYPRFEEPGWQEARSAVEREIRRRHGEEAEFALVKAELGRFARLQAAAAVQAWRFDLAAP
jgi:SAM-dependent methyltransferase